MIDLSIVSSIDTLRFALGRNALINIAPGKITGVVTRFHFSQGFSVFSGIPSINHNPFQQDWHLPPMRLNRNGGPSLKFIGSQHHLALRDNRACISSSALSTIPVVCGISRGVDEISNGISPCIRIHIHPIP